MPYIKKELRKEFDPIIDDMIDKLKQLGITGNLNYTLFRLAKHLCHRYKDYAAFEADVVKSLKEIDRRLFFPYENKKIEENGDIK
jgi:hypothetical protein